MKNKKTILVLFRRSLVAFLAATILNIVYTPFFHTHENHCCSERCSTEATQTTDSSDENKAVNCNVCKFINVNSILSLVQLYNFVFFAPDEKLEATLPILATLDYSINFANKDPPLL